MYLADIVPLCGIQTGRAGKNGHKYYYSNLCSFVFIRGFLYPISFFLFPISSLKGIDAKNHRQMDERL